MNHQNSQFEIEKNFTLRQPSVRDFPTLMTMEKQCFGEDAWTFLDVISTLSDNSIYKIKANVVDKMAGFCAVDQGGRERIATVLTIAVFPEYRRMGIGRALLNRCECEVDSTRIQLSTAIDNTAAISLYTTEGYKKVKVIKGYYCSGKDAILMEKRLFLSEE